MSDLANSVSALRPFISAKDFDASKRFYRELGFDIAHETHEVAEVVMGKVSFLLQNYYDEAWAPNCGLHLFVWDLPQWWEHITSLRLHEKYGTQAPMPPTKQPWGLTAAYLEDPTGVVWQIADQNDCMTERPEGFPAAMWENLTPAQLKSIPR